ncbi:MAG: protein translocase subunit SecF [Actinomycetota bacterium]
MSRFGRLYRGETDIDFIGRRKLWFSISGVVLLACIVSLLTLQLNFGIEFVGGLQLKVPVAADGPLGDADDLEVVAEVREALAPLGAAGAQIQVSGEGSDRAVLVQTEQTGVERTQRVTDAVEETVGAQVTDSQEIGAEWGGEITDKAIRALIIFLVVVFGFISWRFEWKMAVAAVVAVVHDLTVTAGIYSVVGFEVTPSTVIAILTILGYSLYDTVVVFDKVEEDTTLLAGSGRTTYQDAANLAMNQVFMRSLNTSLTTLLPVAALMFVGVGLLGADTLKDLSLALLVGILTSSYSSIFVATPLLCMWKEREPKYRNVKEKVLREARRAAQVPTSPTEAAEGRLAPATAGPARSTPPSRPARRVGSKKAKRRRRR